MFNLNSNGGQHSITELPNKCPFCHNSITPGILFGYSYNNYLDVFMNCPDNKCHRAFVAYYKFSSGSSLTTYLNQTSLGTLTIKSFSDKIDAISSSFVTIYNQSFASEQQNLTEICGVGYRKALEFLIKDYSILNNPSDKDKIEKMYLSNVIENYVNDSRINTVSKRAVWIGNDETHYIRKWEGKNLEDLKKLIDLTLHWIEMEALTASFEKEMPE